MKIKLPITEEFLWAIYELFEEAGRVNEIFGPRSLSEAVCPGIRGLRYEARRRYGRERFANLIYRLKKRELIKAPDWNPKEGIIITKKGIERIFHVTLKLKGQKRRSDGKWQMVVFDIPETRRKARNQIRSYLKRLGYKQFQQSIWISPFDVLRETQNIISHCNAEDYIKIFLVEKP